MYSNKQQKKQKFHCKFYLQGTCKNGTKCKFLHPVNSIKKCQTQQNQKNVIKQLNNKQSKPLKTNKSTKQQYFDGLIDSIKIVCYSCCQKVVPVYLSCGCGSICQTCAGHGKKCGQNKHQYDTKIFIK